MRRDAPRIKVDTLNTQQNKSQTILTTEIKEKRPTKAQPLHGIASSNAHS